MPQRLINRVVRSMARSVSSSVRAFRCRAALRGCSRIADRAGGTAVVRHYWHTFLNDRRSLIRGVGLEIDTISTLQAYGGERLERCLAMNVVAGDGIDIVADLCDAWGIEAEKFDVFINQFAFHVIGDDRRALFHSLRILKPGGTLLCNFVCTSWFPEKGFDCGTGRYEMMRWYTPAGVRSMLRAFLPDSCIDIEVFGNRMMHVAYVLALGVENFPRAAVDARETGWPVLICAALSKPENWDEEAVAAKVFAPLK